jgi:hypothetical protein
MAAAASNRALIMLVHLLGKNRTELRRRRRRLRPTVKLASGAVVHY